MFVTVWLSVMGFLPQIYQQIVRTHSSLLHLIIINLPVDVRYNHVSLSFSTACIQIIGAV